MFKSVLLLLIIFSLSVGLTGAEIPPTPVSLIENAGDIYPFWVNWTFSAGTGNVTDGYNITISNNSGANWFNGTNTFYNLTGIASAYQNTITVYAWNNTGDGNLSVLYISDSYTSPCQSGVMCINQILDGFNAIWSIVDNIASNFGSILTLVVFGVVMAITYIFKDYIKEMLKGVTKNSK